VPSPIDALIRRLQARRKELDYEFKVELPKAIGIARAHGDLSENAEYHAARERHAFVKAQLAQLDAQLAQVRSIDLRQIPTDRVGLYSEIHLFDGDSGEEVTWSLVTSGEADFEAGRISIASPIGRALMGRREADEVRVQVPSGTRTFEIQWVKTIHEHPPVPEAEPEPEPESEPQAEES
jgi:transcription elongation factor GreA